MTGTLRQGATVRLCDPMRIGVRFWDATRRVVVGTHGQAVPRECLDRVGVVAECGKAGRLRVCWTLPNDSTSMWLDAVDVQPVAE